jgi:hypothetical protein
MFNKVLIWFYYGFTLGFFIHGFWAGRKSSIVGVWAAPVAPKTIPEGGERSPAHFGMVLGAAGAAQTPNKSTISGRPKNHVSKI